MRFAVLLSFLLTVSSAPAMAGLLSYIEDKFHKPVPPPANGGLVTDPAVYKKKQQEYLQLLYDRVGFCHPLQTYEEEQILETEHSIYDRLLLEQAFKEFPAKEAQYFAPEDRLHPEGNNRRFTVHDFIGMDVLARTLYGEMAVCANADDKRDGYMRAVAKVILNRARAARTDPLQFKRFINPPQSNLRTDYVSRVILSPMQFTIWNHPSSLKDQEQLNLIRRNFCPHPPNAPEDVAWTRAVKIAVDAVLQPYTFADSVKAFPRDYLYYTSAEDMSKRGWQREPAPVIQGQVLNDYNCMIFWKAPLKRKRHPASKPPVKKQKTNEQKATKK